MASINFLLLVELIVVVIVASAFLFYWNRLFASLCAFLIRLYTWRRHNAYISIGSLQLSPLAGRIAFRDLEYHSSNLSLRALHGHITFRYWKLRIRQEGDAKSANVKRNRLPCRIALYAEGVEGFVFNRTPAYDGIVERMKKFERADAPSSPQSATFGTRLRRKAKVDGARSNSNSADSVSSKPSLASEVSPPASGPAPVDSVNWFREILPIEINVHTGSIILGSDATPMLLIGEFKAAEGTLQVTESRSPWDQYKTTADIRFESPVVLMRTNVDYSGPLLAHGQKSYNELYSQHPEVAKQPPSILSSFLNFHSLAKKLPFLRDPKFSSPPVAGLPRDKMWKGLARYRVSETQKPIKKEEREYAKVTTLLESPALDLTYYADTPGPVPDKSEVGDDDEFGNIDKPPEYGIDIVIHGGTFKYGPWADRQRDALQRAFAPAIFFDSEPRPRLRAGESRIHTHLVVNISMAEETLLRIPTRESSKDWTFDNNPDAERRYGWLDLTVGTDTSVTYTQAQFAAKDGYEATLSLHLLDLSIASSVNLETFVVSKTCQFHMTMPTPLRWDAQRNWGLDVTMDTADITLLRDHIQLISDLARDWSSGAVSDFHHFVPNHYSFRVTLLNYALHLYLNDYNIVNRPRSRSDNAFMDLYGPELSAYVAVAATQYRPEFSVVPFSVDTHDARVEICLPVWDTHRSFGQGDVIEIGKIGKLGAQGSYRYYAVPHPDHQEHLTLHLDAEKVIYKMLGWTLRRLFCVKDNYFGSFTQFTTMQEFLERFDHDPASVGDPVEEKYRPGKSDPFSCEVTMDVTDSLILMSDEIYQCESGLALPVPQLQMALRSTEHYLDLSLDALPTYVVPTKTLQDVYANATAPPAEPREIIFIEGIEVKAHRLFGPQPRATTYVCIWEINVPRITCFLSPEMERTIQSVRQAVIYNFEDFDNSPAELYLTKSPPDVTFLKVGLGSATMTMFADETAACVGIPKGVNVDVSTWATRSFKASIGVVMPEITGSFLVREAGHWKTLVSLRTDLNVQIYNAPSGWREQGVRQQEFIQEQDAPTRRVDFLYISDESSSVSHVRGQYLPKTDFADVSEDGETASDPITDADSSSAGSETPSETATPLRRPTRLASYVTAKENISTSDIDSSDTESSYSSAPSGVRHTTDMSAALAQGMEQLKQFKMDARDRTVPSAAVSDEFNLKRDQLSDGRVIRIACSSFLLHGTIDAIAPVAALGQAMADLSHSPDRLLDNLLLWQVAPILHMVRKESVMIGVQIPLFGLHVDMPTADPRSSSALDVRLSGINHSLTNHAAIDSDFAGMDTILSAQSVSVCASTTETVAGGSLPSATAASLPYALFDISIDEFQAGYSSEPETQHVRHHTKRIELTFVNPFIPLALSWIDRIRRDIRHIPQKCQPPSLYISLLYRICCAAEQSDLRYVQPPFIYETAYGLHVQDARSIRADAGWMMLARLRYWRQQIPLKDTTNDMSDAEMGSAIIQKLAQLDDASGGDTSLVLRQDFIRHAISGARKDATEEAKQLYVTSFMGQAQVVHHGLSIDGEQTVASTFTVTSVNLGVHKTHRESESERSFTVVAVQSAQLDLRDTLLTLIDHLPPPTPKKPTNSKAGPQVNASIEIRLGQFDATAVAAGLKSQLQSQDLAAVIHRRGSSVGDSKMNKGRQFATVTAKVLDLSLLQPHEIPTPGTPDRLVIAFRLQGIRHVSDFHLHPSHPNSARILLGTESIKIESRPQVSSLLSFAKDWKSRHSPKYAPHIDAVVKRIKEHEDQGPSWAEETDLQIDISTLNGQLLLRAAKSVWLRWEIGKVYLSEQKSRHSTKFGVRVAPQTIGAYPSSKKAKDADAAIIKLPSVSGDGTYWTDGSDNPNLSATVQLGFFIGLLKPTMLKRLFVLQQRMESMVKELFEEYQQNHRQIVEPRSASSPLRIDLQCHVAGVRFGLRANEVSTTMLFEALSLHVHANNLKTDKASLLWRAKVDHLGMSLGHLGSGALSSDAEPMRKHRSAYMVFDVDAQEIPGVGHSSSQLNIQLNQTHTVMHVAALSELTDLVKYWKSDISMLRDDHADEMAEVKTNTTKFIKKLDPADKSGAPETSWFATRLFSVNVAGLGIAIPLTDAAAIDLQHRDNAAVPALLFSIRTITFQNKRNEVARFRVQQLSLQFVERFDQGLPDHFTDHYHASPNRMTLPSLDSEAQMATTDTSWTLSAHCSATDFKLALTPDVVDGFLQLADLYDQGRERLSELETHYRSEIVVASSQSTPDLSQDGALTPTTRKYKQRIKVRMSFNFNSGIVELHPSAVNTVVQPKTSARRSTWLDRFKLPTISLWLDHVGPDPAVSGATENPGLIILNLAVHESRNVVRPSVLPFFVDMVNRIESRIHESRKKAQTVKVPPPEPLAAGLSDGKISMIAPIRGTEMKIRLSLRIDRSELRLSCAPDSSAYVDVKWTSGGFLASTTLGKDDSSTIAGSISGVTASLSHEFAERGRSCVEAGAKDMAFSVTLCPGQGSRQSGVSVVFDTALSGQFRLDAFSAWLIFVSVWVDNAPRLDLVQRPIQESTIAATDARDIVAAARPNKLGVAALVRFRTIDFEANIGVSRARLEITPISLRTASNGEKTEFDLQIGTTQVSAAGDVSGSLQSSSLRLQTMRKSSRASSTSDTTILSLSIEGGDLGGSLFLAEKNILRFHLDPSHVTLADDWKAFSRDPNSQIFLSFTVQAGQFQGVLRLLAIPGLLGNLYTIIDTAESQSIIATQRSEIFKSTRSKKQSEPSPMAAVILQSAKKVSAAIPATNVRTAQTMRFDLAGIDIGLFNEDFEHGQIADFYRFVIGKIEADLKRHLSSDDLPTRDLGLLISHIRWDSSDGSKVAAQEKKHMTAGQIMQIAQRMGRNEVASLPVMTLVMNSVEYSKPRILDFDFDLTWGETDGDVKILPNFFEQAYLAFRKLLKGLDEQELVRSRRLNAEMPSVHRHGHDKTNESVTDPAIEFRERDPSKAERLPIPRLKMLGEGTTDMAKLIPRIRSGVKELPKLSHRFVTLPLEEGMDLLLKLYERQLPEHIDT